jgi:hypothetical protein
MDKLQLAGKNKKPSTSDCQSAMITKGKCGEVYGKLWEVIAFM